MCVWQHNGQIIENSSTDTEYDEDDYTVTTDLKAGHCVVKVTYYIIRSQQTVLTEIAFCDV